MESMPRDEIRKKIAPWWVSAKKCAVENYTGHTGKSERRWPLRAELENCLWENARKNTIAHWFKEGDVLSLGKVGKLDQS